MSQQKSSFYLDGMEFLTSLSAEETEQILEMCRDHGITVKQLLTQFICDLIDNDRSGGSDERMMISGWFNRSFWNF